MNVLYHRCFGLFVALMFFSGATLSSMSSISFENWLYASLSDAPLSMIGGWKFHIIASFVSFVVFQTFLLVIWCCNLLILTSTEAIQWSDEMKVCLLCIMNFSSDIISVYIRSNVFPSLCVGPDMCCSNLLASFVIEGYCIVILKVVHVYVKLPKYDYILFGWYSVITFVKLSTNIALGILLAILGSGWYIPMTRIGLFLYIYISRCHIL